MVVEIIKKRDYRRARSRFNLEKSLDAQLLGEHLTSALKPRVLDSVDVSLVMPAYNESQSISSAIRKVDAVLDKTNWSYELIVVDDGSVDKTREILLTEKYSGRFKLTGYSTNMGKGYALKKGFLKSKGTYVLFLDSDLDINPNQIEKYVMALGKGDIVISSKRHPESIIKVPFIRTFMSYGFNFLVRLLTGLSVYDTQTGLKAVRRDATSPVFKVLSIRRFAFDVELLVVASLLGLKIIELPINISLNKFFNPIEACKMLIDLLKISYNLRITKWYQSSLNLHH